jgi:multidrug transporter EmrE-like cation transporter
MKTKRWAILLVLISTLCASSGQILIKHGTNNLDVEILTKITETKTILEGILPTIFGYGLYGLAAAMLIVSLKHGELSVLYPIYAMNFVWVAIMSPIFFPLNDSMNPLKWAGIAAVVLGVAFIGMGSGGENG